jgi:hypothetical protein
MDIVAAALAAAICVGDSARRYASDSATGLLEGPFREMGLAILHMRTMRSVQIVAPTIRSNARISHHRAGRHRSKILSPDENVVA